MGNCILIKKFNPFLLEPQKDIVEFKNYNEIKYMHKKYKEQYKRMKRWYERFNMINRGTSISESFDYYKDNTYAFFINCYHLKDWILYDSSLYKPSSTEKEFKEESKKMEEDTKKFIKESMYLKICQDLCNGNKHLRLTRPASDANTKIGMINVKMESNNKSSKIKTRINFVVRVKNKNIDAFELASKCIKEWDKFLKRKKLEIPKDSYSDEDNFKIKAIISF